MIWVAGVVLQPDLDRNRRHFLLADAEPAHLRPDLENFLLADGEVHIDRVGLHDGGELGRAIGSHQLAQRHLARRHDPVEGGLHLRIAEVERGLLGLDLGLLQLRRRRVLIGRGIVERDLGGDLAARQVGLALIVHLRLFHRGLRAGLGGLRLLELQLVRCRLDGEEGLAYLHLFPVLVIDRLHEALHARDQIGGVDRGDVTRGLEIAGDLLLNRERHGHLRRRRRHIAVVLPAGRQRRDEGGGGARAKTIPTRRLSDRHRATSTSRFERRRLGAGGRRPSLTQHSQARGYDRAIQRGTRFRGVKTQPAPEGAGCPLPPYSSDHELVLSTVTARRFCDQHEMSLHTATGRSLP